MSSTSGGKTVRVILIVWFCFALIVGISGRFRVVSAPIVAATVWTSTAVALFAWNAFGLIDIVFVAFSALRFGLKDWQPMTPCWGRIR